MGTYAIRVKPGSSRTRVGGAYGDPPALVVAVTETAVGGRATEAALRAVAEALDMSRSCVEIVSGHVARTKIVRIEGNGVEARWTALLGLSD